MVLIHEKITALLEQRRLKKRDLARALGVSPQTATDICKGRSAITLPHLRNLISYFEVRAEFWLDDDRLAPIEIDQLDNGMPKAYALPEVSSDEPDPVVQIIDESNNEVVYTVRIKGTKFTPGVRKRGTYTVKVGDNVSEGQTAH